MIKSTALQHRFSIKPVFTWSKINDPIMYNNARIAAVNPVHLKFKDVLNTFAHPKSNAKMGLSELNGMNERN